MACQEAFVVSAKVRVMLLCYKFGVLVLYLHNMAVRYFLLPFYVEGLCPLENWPLKLFEVNMCLSIIALQ